MRRLTELTLSLSLSALVAIGALGCGGGGDGGSGGTGGAGSGGSGGGGSGGDIYYCDLTASAGYCQEYVGLEADGVVATYEGACTSTWGAAPCPRTDAVGGCGGPAGGGFTFTLVNWFYLGGLYSDSSAMQTACEGGGDTFYTP